MEENKTSIGSVIATIIIIALIVLGGLYFWGKRIEQQQAVQSFTPTTTNEPVVNQTETVGTSSPVISTTTSTKSTKK
jgi:flagellar biosynthesis component FlhA